MFDFPKDLPKHPPNDFPLRKCFSQLESPLAEGWLVVMKVVRRSNRTWQVWSLGRAGDVIGFR
jgi:hypothetical protein